MIERSRGEHDRVVVVDGPLDVGEHRGGPADQRLRARGRGRVHGRSRSWFLRTFTAAVDCGLSERVTV